MKTNTKFLKLLNYKNGELIGKHHRILVPEAYAKTQSLSIFWKKLDQKKIVEGEFISITGDDTEVKILGSYFPVSITMTRYPK